MIRNNFLQSVDRQEIPFTPRQIEILQLLANGLSREQIGKRLGIEWQTVKNQIFIMMNRMGVPWERRNINYMISYAYYLGAII